MDVTVTSTELILFMNWIVNSDFNPIHETECTILNQPYKGNINVVGTVLEDVVLFG